MYIPNIIERVGENDLEELLNYAKEIILSIGGNEADIEQITDEIIESGYTTFEEVKFHFVNYYMD